MSDAILDNGGTLLGFLGDGVLAVFGAPIASDDHADRALVAARQMLHERLPRFNAWARSELDGDADFRMGIGVCSGAFMSGNVGSARRLEYTAIGDPVNTAARLQELTKELRHPVLVSDSTRALLQGDERRARVRRGARRPRQEGAGQALDARSTPRMTGSFDDERAAPLRGRRPAAARR